MEEDRVRVLFAIGSLGGGGAERQTLHLLRHLDRSRFQPLLYLTYRQGELLPQVPAEVPIDSYWDRHRAPTWNWPGRIRRQQVADLARILDAWRVDLLCAITFHLALIAVDAVRRRPTPWLAVEMADPRLAFRAQTSRFRGLKRRLVASAYRQAARCVGVSDGVGRGIQAYFGTPADRIATLVNCVDVAEIDRLAADPAPPLAAGRFHIATMGRLDPQKGQQFLIEACRDLVQRQGLRHLHLHLLGQGPLAGSLQAYVQRHHLSENVTFAGFQANPFAYLRRCDLFCLPSLFEGLPLALLEAMACRLPVLAADCPSGPREILAGGQYGDLVPPGDAAALAAAIRALSDDPQRAARLRQAGRERVVQAYSVQACIPQWERLFLDIARPAPA